MTQRKKGRVGSSFEKFLEKDGIREEVQAVAIKRVLAWQVAEAMEEQGITKAEMARQMRTSRSQLDRLLDPDNESVALQTLARAAHALGRQLRLELV